MKRLHHQIMCTQIDDVSAWYVPVCTCDSAMADPGNQSGEVCGRSYNMLTYQWHNNKMGVLHLMSLHGGTFW